MWKPNDDGKSLGKLGSEGGTVILEDRHSDGALITLEMRCRDCIPFAITCGVFGLMVHTCSFLWEDEARRSYAEMKDAVSTMLARLLSDPEDTDLAADLCAEFIDRFD